MVNKKPKQRTRVNWMDTYGDMVTLLLCFFVLLYSMSTIDQVKWLEIVRSFNPNAIPDITATEGYEGPVADPVEAEVSQDEIDQNIDQLYRELQEYVEQQNAENNISVSKGDGYIFISLNNAVFFAGDSHVITPEGQGVLDDVGIILAKVGDSIDELRVLGHTAQGTADDVNNYTVDRLLASNRATNVLIYLQYMEFMDPARMVSVGYGQWRPISSNDTREDRAANRRVEIIITGKNVEDSLSDSITQYYTQREIVPETEITFISEDDLTLIP